MRVRLHIKAGGIGSIVSGLFDSLKFTFQTPGCSWSAFTIQNTLLIRTPAPVTIPCELEDLCYEASSMIEKYLNLESSFAALGVPPAVKNYSITVPAVEQAFGKTVDIQISTGPQILYLLKNQIDVLLYQGNLDLACNTAGAKRFTANLQWKGQAAFTAKELKPWTSMVNGTETTAGTFKEVNIKMVDGDDKTTRFALVTIDKSGHMVWTSPILQNCNF